MIEFRDLHKAFGPKRVLEGLTLTVPDGSTTALLGFSGTGKSVALKHVVGLLVPDRGEVRVDGAVVADLDPEALSELRARVGY
ncbi:MAG TPA: ATP-binding cassette domain-containing protein, partial [Gemmatimonadales bacterium]|nr:ATP-binding cassette domain-containing protein [Gemmatimonadales bacterium]